MSLLRRGLSESDFRVFEPLLSQVLRSYPATLVVTVTGSGYNRSTFSARLRDAARSLRLYNWPLDWSYIPESLAAFCVAPHPTDLNQLLVGPRITELARPIVPIPLDSLAPVAINPRRVPPVPFVVGLSSPFYHSGSGAPVIPSSDHVEFRPQELMLEYNANISFEYFLKCIEAYVVLATANVQGLASMKVRKANMVDDQLAEVDEFLKTLSDTFNVAYTSDEDHFTLI